MAATKARITFWSLSAELRARVYELVLDARPGSTLSVDLIMTKDLVDNYDHVGSPEYWIPYGSAQTQHSSRLGTMWPQPAKVPAITQVSKQLRKEALPMWLKLFHFCAWIDDLVWDVTWRWDFYKYGKVVEWLRMLGLSNVTLIKSFSLYFPTETDAGMRATIRQLRQEREDFANEVPYEGRERNAEDYGPGEIADRNQLLVVPPVNKFEIIEALGLEGLGLRMSAVRVLHQCGTSRPSIVKLDFVEGDGSKASGSAGNAASMPPSEHRPRTKQIGRKTTGGKAPRKKLASK